MSDYTKRDWFKEKGVWYNIIHTRINGILKTYINGEEIKDE